MAVPAMECPLASGKCKDGPEARPQRGAGLRPALGRLEVCPTLDVQAFALDCFAFGEDRLHLLIDELAGLQGRQAHEP